MNFVHEMTKGKRNIASRTGVVGVLSFPTVPIPVKFKTFAMIGVSLKPKD